MTKQIDKRGLLDMVKAETTKRRLPVMGLLALLGLALLPLLGFSNYVLHILVLVFVYVALGLGLNIVVGLAGLLDLGYVAFYAVGAYSYALLSLYYDIPFAAALGIGAGLAGVIGVVLGWPTIRTRGDYLALVTLGFGEMIRLLLRNWDSLTNGPRGIMNVPPPSLVGFVFATPVYYYYLGLLLGTAALILFQQVKYSAVGQQLAAICDDEDAAAAIGINPVRWKLYAFALGAFVAGLSGVFFASWQRFVSPESFTLSESILILSIVVLGGGGRLWPTAGAATFLVLLPEALRGLETHRVLVLGIILVGVVILQEKVRLAGLGRRQAVSSSSSGSTAIMFDSLSDTYPPSDQPGRGELVLSLSGVSKGFGGIRALDNVSLQVRHGEVVGLVGPNGAGKTTLLGCISGAIRPDSGEIYLFSDGNQRSVRGLSVHQVARLGLGRTFQQPRLFTSLTARENVELGARCTDVPPIWEPFLPSGRGQAASSDNAARILQNVGAPDPETPVQKMSFVDRKLTELARALATHPALILVDEPAAGMEPAARRRLAHVLRSANEKLGIAQILVEHDLTFLNSICDRLVVMDRGQIVANDAPGDVHVTEAIRQIYQAPEVTHCVA